MVGRRDTFHDSLKPIPNITFSNTWLSVGHGTRTVTFWKNTSHEREILLLGVGNNLIMNQHPVTMECKYEPIEINDYNKVKNIELENLRIYPEFNERLLLCSEFEKDYDPLKEIAFNRELPLNTITYIDIIGGQIELKELGY